MKLPDTVAFFCHSCRHWCFYLLVRPRSVTPFPSACWLGVPTHRRLWPALSEKVGMGSLTCTLDGKCVRVYTWEGQHRLTHLAVRSACVWSGGQTSSDPEQAPVSEQSGGYLPPTAPAPRPPPQSSPVVCLPLRPLTESWAVSGTVVGVDGDRSA